MPSARIKTALQELTEENIIEAFRNSITVTDLLKYVSVTEFIALLEAYGGFPLYVPNGTASKVAKIISSESLSRLASQYGGDFIPVPKFDTLTRWLRDREICSNTENISVREMARRYGLTPRRVNQIIKHNKGNGSCR
jgi:Mor family transcriptional regulator